MPFIDKPSGWSEAALIATCIHYITSSSCERDTHSCKSECFLIMFGVWPGKVDLISGFGKQGIAHFNNLPTMGFSRCLRYDPGKEVEGRDNFDNRWPSMNARPTWQQIKFQPVEDICQHWQEMQSYFRQRGLHIKDKLHTDSCKLHLSIDFCPPVTHKIRIARCCCVYSFCCYLSKLQRNKVCNGI